VLAAGTVIGHGREPGQARSATVPSAAEGTGTASAGPTSGRSAGARGLAGTSADPSAEAETTADLWHELDEGRDPTGPG